jgi:hypothetical protein
MTHTDQRLREIAERENKATNGPWEAERNRDWDEWRVVNNSDDGCRPIISCTEQPGREETDAMFIAHSRQDVPWLLALIKKQREALEIYAFAASSGKIARDALNFSPENL